MAPLENVNPLIPAGYDIVWTAVIAVSFVALIVAIVLIARAAARR
jgi:hypothetical protein